MILNQIFPGEVDPTALAAGANRAAALLHKAAGLNVSVIAEADSFRAIATLTNRTGHKLPTGYPEGRRMWLHLVAYDAASQPIFESGSYDPATGTLQHDESLAIYEAELGISPPLAQALGQTAGVSFHFVLNDSVYRDTRIPPLGFTNTAFATFGGVPVDPEHPGTRYADGQNWDAPTYGLPEATRKVIATLYYQTTSKDYVTFLKDANVTDGSGQLMFDLWSNNGRAAPVAMVADTIQVVPADVAGGESNGPRGLEIGVNPFREQLTMRLSLGRTDRVSFEVYDLQGRKVHAEDCGVRNGIQMLTWDGRDARGNAVGSGIYWVRFHIGDEIITRRVVRIR
jgi:hypothetical protein